MVTTLVLAGLLGAAILGGGDRTTWIAGSGVALMAYVRLFWHGRPASDDIDAGPFLAASAVVIAPLLAIVVVFVIFERVDGGQALQLVFGLGLAVAIAGIHHASPRLRSLADDPRWSAMLRGWFTGRGLLCITGAGLLHDGYLLDATLDAVAQTAWLAGILAGLAIYLEVLLLAALTMATIQLTPTARPSLG